MVRKWHTVSHRTGGAGGVCPIQFVKDLSTKKTIYVPAIGIEFQQIQ